jgi:hypothetical protein
LTSLLTESSGFFDSCGVPPPEFWVGFYDEILISFIPENFLYVANLGVDICMDDSLAWGEFGRIDVSTLFRTK